MSESAVQYPVSVRFLARAALISVAVYLCVDIVLAFLRPDYSLVSNAESDYGRGPYAWLMDANFFVRAILSVCVLIVLTRIGIARRASIVLLACWAFGSALLALFPENVPGYPELSSGSIHIAIALLAFLCVAIATLRTSIRMAAGRHPLWPVLLALSIVGAVSLLMLPVAIRPLGVVGLVERVFLGCQLAWLAFVVWSSAGWVRKREERRE